ncbi:hypothetical protein PG993_013114 [Apiospora rasikravindrae]|uniref:Uncharacterized protein n=1 Tax=Apiospora rasikravindrae TaxID=990691 RepID=A0ABR1RWR3_9PEZI
MTSRPRPSYRNIVNPNRDWEIRYQSDHVSIQRTLLLSRGDVLGKALAYPKSLTLAEKYEAMGWMSLDELHAAEGIDEGLFDQFEDYYQQGPELRKAGYESPTVFANFLNSSRGRYPPFPPHHELTLEPPATDDSSGHFELTRRDGVHAVTGQRHLPGFFRYDGGSYPLPPKKLFMRDLMRRNGTKQPLSGVELSDKYHALSTEERAEYEVLRQAAWDDWEQGS